jgi:3-isopropylmalate dehydratase small subunit
MSLQARAIVIPGDDIDTDVLYPGTYLNVTEVEQMTHHLFEGLDPTLRNRLGGDTALVVGSNFGCGSSREHVPQAMCASGIRFLVGAGFARIFYRNCINLGLPAVVSEAAVAAARDDSTLELDLEDGAVVVDGTRLALSPVPPFMREIFAAGGLIPWVRAQGGRSTIEA